MRVHRRVEPEGGVGKVGTVGGGIGGGSGHRHDVGSDLGDALGVAELVDAQAAVGRVCDGERADQAAGAAQLCVVLEPDVDGLGTVAAKEVADSVGQGCGVQQVGLCRQVPVIPSSE